MRKLITSLGTSAYQPVRYRYANRDHESRFVQVALLHLLDDVDEIHVLATQLAGERNLEPLKAEISSSGLGLTLHQHTIPDCKNEEELWDLFRVVGDQMGPGDDIFLDITHGFRTLPFLTFLVSSFKHFAYDVNIEAVLYGSFEGRTPDGTAPILDLTPLVFLQEWSSAIDAFNKFGEARRMAELARRIERTVRKNAAVSGSPIPKSMEQVVERLADLSQQLPLVRTKEIASAAQCILDNLPSAEAEISEYIPPLSDMMSILQQSIEPIACSAKDLDERALAAQYHLVTWYAERNMVMQALTLAREWLVTYVLYKLGYGENWLDNLYRSRIERVISGSRQEGQSLADPEDQSRFALLDGRGSVLKAWDTISNLRNDINHAGMRNDSMQADKLIAKCRAAVTEGLAALGGAL